MGDKITIEAGGRTLPLVFDMLSWGEIEEAVGQLQDIGEMLNQKGRIRTVLTLIRILANEGLECDGKEPDVTEKWLGRHIKPQMLGDLSMKIMDAIAAGMKMEASADDGKKEIDVVLQEINKKKDKED